MRATSLTMEPYDTGRPGEPAGARLDRLRNRPIVPVARPSRGIFAWALVAALLAFALGLIANPWFERSVRSRLPGFAPTVAPTVADLAALDARVAALETRPAAVGAAGGSDQPDGERLARVEGSVATLGATLPAATARTDRIATDLAALSGRIDGGTAAAAAALASATASADRAQAMLVVGAVRRLLGDGERLGPFDSALRRSFGARAGPAVEAVAALGTNPVTLAALRDGLDKMRPALGATTATASQGWWAGFRDSLAGIVVRPNADHGTAARIDRAAAALAGGNVATAVAEINALPAALRSRAHSWLDAAGRYQAGWRGIGALEAMLLDPSPVSASPVPGT